MLSPPPSSLPNAAGRARWRRAAQTAGAQGAAKIVSGLCQLAIVPLLLGHLGTQTFGWTMALVALVGLTQFADLGVQTALQQELAEAWGRGDPDQLRRIYVAGKRLLTLLALGWFVIALPVGCWLGPRLLPAPVAGADLPSWFVLVATTCLAVRLSAGGGLAMAIQAGWIHAIWSAAFNLAAVLASVVIARAGGPPAAFILILALVQILPPALTGWQIARQLGWTGADALFDRATAARLWREGLQYAPSYVTAALLHAATPVAFARYGGYGAAAVYATLQRLFGPLAHAHAVALNPLWPAYAEARSRGDAAWGRHAFRVSLVVTLGAVAVAAAIAALLPWITPLWLGRGTFPPSATLAWLLAGVCGASMVVVALSYFLLGHRRMARIAPALAAAQVATLALVAGAGTRWGATGVAAALLGGVLFGQLPVLMHACLRAKPNTN
jgi:O-antigen/teichoic acid export membrane protein